LVSGLENGRIGGPLPDVEENIFDAHQAFLDLVQHFGEKDTLTWRLGRQSEERGLTFWSEHSGCRSARRAPDFPALFRVFRAFRVHSLRVFRAGCGPAALER
jgi:hypothetical protein